MVLIISTFKVANGMEGEVRQAFLRCPGIVDNAPGFLGIEVCVDRQDTSIFHLLTRWTDEASFQSWHSGPLRHLAHRGVPEGLKLDPAFTAIRKFEVLPSAGKPPREETEEAPIARLPAFLARSRLVHWLRLSLDGRIVECNRAFERLFQESSEGLAGKFLHERLTQPDAALIEAFLKSDGSAPEDSLLLNFVSGDQSVETLECFVERHRETFVMMGEPVAEHDRALFKELMELNNRWALLVRENGKNAKALQRAKDETESAMAELEQSHWHLRKIQETLPICMYCGKVKTGESEWEGVVEYLKENSLFLSHGCCPACLEGLNEAENKDANVE